MENTELKMLRSKTLNMVGHEGVRGKVNVPMTDEEVRLLRKSADTLKDVISNLEI